MYIYICAYVLVCLCACVFCREEKRREEKKRREERWKDKDTHNWEDTEKKNKKERV